MFNVNVNCNANLNLDVNIVLAIQGQKRPLQVLGKICFRGKTSQIIVRIVFLVEHVMKRDKKLRSFLAKNPKLLILTFSVS